MVPYSEIHAKLSETNSIHELLREFRLICEKLDIDHISFWGVDDEKKRIFFVMDLSEKIKFSEENLRVIDFGDGFLGKCLVGEPPKIEIRTGPEEIEKAGFLADSFIRKHNISLIMAIPMVKRLYYKSIFLLAGKTSLKHSKEECENFVFMLDVFLAQYGRIRNMQYRELLLELGQSSLTESMNMFFSTIDMKLRQYFPADSFSVWVLKPDNKIHNLFFSGKPANFELNYDPGEGATGTCFKSGRAILAHRMSDLSPIEKVPWKGKVSEFTVPPAQGDHGLFIPILAFKKKEEPRESIGVMRLVSAEKSTSFWPHDLGAAQAVAEVIGLRFSHDAILLKLGREKDRLMQLLQLSSEVAQLGTEANFSKSAFDSLVDNYQLVNIAYVIYHIQPQTIEIKFNNNFPDDQIDNLAKALIKDKPKEGSKIVSLKSGKYVGVMLGREKLEEFKEIGVFILEFIRTLHEEDSASLELFSTVLEISWENSRMYKERQDLLEKWERVEAANRAGIIAREFAHEVKQGCKTIDAWISNSKSGSKAPNYDSLSNHVAKLDEFAAEILNKSSLKYKPQKCFLNNIVRDALRTYGMRHDTQSLLGHKLSLEYSPLLWEKNQPCYHVFIDPDAMVSVLRNLLNNAFEQYAQIGKKGPIEISTYLNTTEGHPVAVLCIKDYAGGVDPSMRRKMWEAFETNKEGGSGIGLFSAATLVIKRMDGTIDEIGEPGYALFKIVLDAKEED